MCVCKMGWSNISASAVCIAYLRVPSQQTERVNTSLESYYVRFSAYDRRGIKIAMTEISLTHTRHSFIRFLIESMT